MSNPETAITAEIGEARAEIARLRGLFCEAHGYDSLQPDVPCPMCEAVHADDDLKLAQAEIARLTEAFQYAQARSGSKRPTRPGILILAASLGGCVIGLLLVRRFVK